MFADVIKSRMKESLRKTLILVLLNPVSIIGALSLYLILGNTDLALSMPPFNAFIHVRPDHFIINMISCFVLLIPEVNKFSIKQIVVIASLISVA